MILPVESLHASNEERQTLLTLLKLTLISSQGTCFSNQHMKKFGMVLNMYAWALWMKDFCCGAVYWQIGK